ncbi:MAG: tetratricopeptide repeat protein [Gemmatimonadaceae bacterium]
MQRRAVTAVALTMLSSAPAALMAQTTRGPTADTPRLLVAVCASNDRLAGVQAADAMRTRIQNAANIRQLFVIPKADITNYLESSGYKADSALGASDLKELAKLLRADEVISCTVTRTAAGLKIEPRLLLARDVSWAQPLSVAEAANPADASRAIERSLNEARKQMVDQKTCWNQLVGGAHDRAIAAANAGIAKYPSATIARLCLASVYQAMKTPPDSVLRVVAEIRRIDPKNSFALRLAYGAYSAKDDPENAVRALVALMALEPTNTTLQNQVITELGKLGKPSIALPIVDTLLAQNPGDPQLLRQKWLLTLASVAGADTGAARTALIESALTTGQSMTRMDTTLADSVYFSRQIAVATALTSQPRKAVEIASLAVQKYPNNPEFWALKAQLERKAGQLQMAQQSLNRALAIAPKYPNATLLLATIYLDMNQPDSAVATARRAVAAGEDSKIWGGFLLGPTQTLVKQAQATDSVFYWERALALSQEADRLAPSATSKFFVGLSSFYVGADGLRVLNAEQKKSKPDKGRVCSLARNTQDMFLLTQTNMPAGGAISPDAARQVLGAVSQYGAPLNDIIKQNCKR